MATHKSLAMVSAANERPILKNTIILFIGKLILRFSYTFHCFVPGRASAQDSLRGSWVVGVDEIASMLWRVHKAIPNSISVALSEHNFYSYSYTYTSKKFKSPRFSFWYRIVFGPWILGRLSRTNYGFIYLGTSGFLFDPRGQREYEFSFLKQRGLKIVCYFTGDDIRSHVLLKQVEERINTRTLASVLAEDYPVFLSDEYDKQKQKIALVADTYADAIFNWPVEQISYLQRPVHRFEYAYPDELFNADFEKFKQLKVIKIVHAPSNPKIKGTEFVREAIHKLQEEGREIEYTELMNVSNEELLKILATTHIVLNQFLQFTPGVLGIEAMASGCVMLCSADETIEPKLPQGANHAWVVTNADNIYENLSKLLDNTDLLEQQARKGFDWAYRHASRSCASEHLSKILQGI